MRGGVRASAVVLRIASGISRTRKEAVVGCVVVSVSSGSAGSILRRVFERPCTSSGAARLVLATGTRRLSRGALDGRTHGVRGTVTLEASSAGIARARCPPMSWAGVDFSIFALGFVDVRAGVDSETAVGGAACLGLAWGFAIDFARGAVVERVGLVCIAWFADTQAVHTMLSSKPCGGASPDPVRRSVSSAPSAERRYTRPPLFSNRGEQSWGQSAAGGDKMSHTITGVIISAVNLRKSCALNFSGCRRNYHTQAAQMGAQEFCSRER